MIFMIPTLMMKIALALKFRRKEKVMEDVRGLDLNQTKDGHLSKL